MWVTADGKHTYKEVKICKVEADCVTILDDEGGALIDISTLPADLQAKLNYDPELAKQAALAREDEEQNSKRLVAAEKQEEHNRNSAVDANDEAILSEEAAKQAHQAAIASAEQARINAEDAQSDYDIALKHTSLDPLTGTVVGTPYRIARRKRDAEIIANGQ